MKEWQINLLITVGYMTFGYQIGKRKRLIWKLLFPIAMVVFTVLWFKEIDRIPLCIPGDAWCQTDFPDYLRKIAFNQLASSLIGLAAGVWVFNRKKLQTA